MKLYNRLKITWNKVRLELKPFLLSRERTRHLKDFSRQFLVGTSQHHRAILKQMGLENFCVEPYFSTLRHNMRELVEVLAAVAAGVPQQHYGFHRLVMGKWGCSVVDLKDSKCKIISQVRSENEGILTV